MRGILIAAWAAGVTVVVLSSSNPIGMTLQFLLLDLRSLFH